MADTLFTTIDTAKIRRSRLVQFCKKDVLANFAKFTRKQQKRIPVLMFFCEFCEISQSTFLKKPLGWLLLHKHSLCLLSYHDLSPYHKRCHTYFLVEHFSAGLICRLGTKMSLIFKMLTMKAIFKQFKHVRCSFFFIKKTA